MIGQGLIKLTTKDIKQKYLRFEKRWLKSLAQLKMPIQLMWGNEDAVSPMTIPASLAEIINKEFLTVKTMDKTGDFCQVINEK